MVAVMVFNPEKLYYEQVERSGAQIYGAATAELAKWVEATDNWFLAQQTLHKARQLLDELQFDINSTWLTSADDVEWFTDRLNKAATAYEEAGRLSLQFEARRKHTQRNLYHLVSVLPGALWTFYLVDDVDGKTRAYSVQCAPDEDRQPPVTIRVRDLTAEELKSGIR